MSKTWRDGYVPGKAKKTIHLTDEVARALEVRAAEERVRQAEIVERALRKELGIVEKLTWEVIEDDGGTLHLFVFAGDNVIYYADGYEHNPVPLREDLERLRDGSDPRTEGWELPAWVVDGDEGLQGIYDKLTNYEAGWTVVADESGIYYDRMGAAALQALGNRVVREMGDQELQERVIGQPWDVREMLGLDWIDRYPVVDDEGKIVDVVAASDGTPEGLEFDEDNECYREGV